jgi:hypothetical protein
VGLVTESFSMGAEQSSPSSPQEGTDSICPRCSGRLAKYLRGNASFLVNDTFGARMRFTGPFWNALCKKEGVREHYAMLAKESCRKTAAISGGKVENANFVDFFEKAITAIGGRRHIRSFPELGKGSYGTVCDFPLGGVIKVIPSKFDPRDDEQQVVSTQSEAVVDKIRKTYVCSTECSLIVNCILWTHFSEQCIHVPAVLGTIATTGSFLADGRPKEKYNLGLCTEKLEPFHNANSAMFKSGRVLHYYLFSLIHTIFKMFKHCGLIHLDLKQNNVMMRKRPTSKLEEIEQYEAMSAPDDDVGPPPTSVICFTPGSHVPVIIDFDQCVVVPDARTMIVSAELDSEITRSAREKGRMPYWYPHWSPFFSSDRMVLNTILSPGSPYLETASKNSAFAKWLCSFLNMYFGRFDVDQEEDIFPIEVFRPKNVHTNTPWMIWHCLERMRDAETGDPIFSLFFNDLGLAINLDGNIVFCNNKKYAGVVRMIAINDIPLDGYGVATWIARHAKQELAIENARFTFESLGETRDTPTKTVVSREPVVRWSNALWFTPISPKHYPGDPMREFDERVFRFFQTQGF